MVTSSLAASSANSDHLDESSRLRQGEGDTQVKELAYKHTQTHTHKHMHTFYQVLKADLSYTQTLILIVPANKLE